ncbi:MAG TPA: 2-oxoacid:acceptor oxidoreductase family protein [Gaiellaceae bacterium]|nr:2-oxoacid:acceptor oxidoreductase family protein [Gaiellaceae bacterium]
MIEIRWHARAGQGAKTGSHVLAVAALSAGRSVQAFPEYGPERRGAPMRAFTRIDDRPIRRHCAIDRPGAVVVLEPSLLGADVVDGLAADGLLVAITERTPAEVAAATGHRGRVVCVAPGPPRVVNVLAAGALAGALGVPPLADVLAAVTQVLGAKAGEETLAAVRSGFAAAQEERWAA